LTGAAHARDPGGGAGDHRLRRAAAGEAIYEATPGTLIGLLEEQRDVERLMLVGHNPGLERLVALLGSGRSDDYRGMPPAAVAVLTLPQGRAMEPGIGRLDAFWWP